MLCSLSRLQTSPSPVIIQCFTLRNLFISSNFPPENTTRDCSRCKWQPWAARPGGSAGSSWGPQLLGSLWHLVPPVPVESSTHEGSLGDPCQPRGEKCWGGEGMADGHHYVLPLPFFKGSDRVESTAKKGNFRQGSRRSGRGEAEPSEMGRKRPP